MGYTRQASCTGGAGTPAYSSMRRAGSAWSRSRRRRQPAVRRVLQTSSRGLTDCCTCRKPLKRVQGIEPAWPAWKARFPSVSFGWSQPFLPLTVPSACLCRRRGPRRPGVHSAYIGALMPRPRPSCPDGRAGSSKRSVTQDTLRTSRVFVIGGANDPHAGLVERPWSAMSPDGCRSLRRAGAVRQRLMGRRCRLLVGRPAADRVAKLAMTAPARVRPRERSASALAAFGDRQQPLGAAVLRRGQRVSREIGCRPPGRAGVDSLGRAVGLLPGELLGGSDDGPEGDLDAGQGSAPGRAGRGVRRALAETSPA